MVMLLQPQSQSDAALSHQALSVIALIGAIIVIGAVTAITDWINMTVAVVSTVALLCGGVYNYYSVSCSSLTTSEITFASQASGPGGHNSMAFAESCWTLSSISAHSVLSI